MAFYHNPAQQVFNWHCAINHISEASMPSAAMAIKEQISKIRALFSQPLGHTIPYDDPQFRAAYLLTYFPYYIEPVYHVLEQSNIPNEFFKTDNLNVAFFGGGPCPEALGVAAYLRRRARHLKRVNATVFDRQPGWHNAHSELLPLMLPYYKSGNTTFSINAKTCDVVECLARECTCGVAEMDMIVAQNFLTEILRSKKPAIETFERLVTRSRCRYLVFIDNKYDGVKELMHELSTALFAKGLSTGQTLPETAHTRPNFNLPETMKQHLLTGEGLLFRKSNVKFHHMVIEIAR